MSIRRNPFEMMDQMFEQMRRSTMGGTAMGGSPMGEMSRTSDETTGGMPRMGAEMPRTGESFVGGSNLRLEETDEGYVAVADLPGFEREEITVRFEDDRLSITAERETTEESEFAATRRDRRVHEQLRVPAAVREDEIAATYRNGALEVTLPTEGHAEDDGRVVDVQ
ncbi:heat-shock protein Hsp20 [Halobacteriales archaeon QS_1_68_20]|nr:MAG: heat-shock protein Hsp20 [Halobacteriales archaeon QS_1_68_20]